MTKDMGCKAYRADFTEIPFIPAKYDIRGEYAISEEKRQFVQMGELSLIGDFYFIGLNATIIACDDFYNVQTNEGKFIMITESQEGQFLINKKTKIIGRDIRSLTLNKRYEDHRRVHRKYPNKNGLRLWRVVFCKKYRQSIQIITGRAKTTRPIRINANELNLRRLLSLGIIWAYI